MEGPTLHDFTLKHAVKAWWSSCKTSRRPNQSARKQYSPRNAGASTSTAGVAEGTPSSDLIEWDSYFNNDNDMDSECESSSESSSESVD